MKIGQRREDMNKGFYGERKEERKKRNHRWMERIKNLMQGKEEEKEEQKIGRNILR